MPTAIAAPNTLAAFNAEYLTKNVVSTLYYNKGDLAILAGLYRDSIRHKPAAPQKSELVEPLICLVEDL